MRFDCGATAEDPYGDPRFNAIYRGWGRLPPALEEELVILTATPGIPIEWLYAAFKLSSFHRAKLWAVQERFDRVQVMDAGRVNATTITDEDGLRMLRLVPGFTGPCPHWSRLALQQNKMSAVKLAELLGVKVETVRRWRRETVFDPMTLTRLKLQRGRRRGIFEI